MFNMLFLVLLPVFLRNTRALRPVTSDTECEDVSPSDCMTMLSMYGETQMCNKRYDRGAIDDDPGALGIRINMGACHAPSVRVVPGRSLYKYPPLAYAGGVKIGSKRYSGCCPQTCGYCDDITPTSPVGPIDPAERDPQPDPEPMETGAPPKPVVLEKPDFQPEPEPMETVPLPPVVQEEEPHPEPMLDGTLWCREWQDMFGMPEQMCADENGGQFFKRAKTSTGSLKRVASEVHHMKIDGWCCWHPMPRFAGGSGACAQIKCYYPDGNFCDQDHTCPKKYKVLGDAIQEEPGQLCTGKYISRQEEKARAKTC